ncbi:unnamed protein product [Aureobasidium pullulans]|nr:unnamed protein product [Aureobasidium pullulans]
MLRTLWQGSHAEQLSTTVHRCTRSQQSAWLLCEGPDESTLQLNTATHPTATDCSITAEEQHDENLRAESRRRAYMASIFHGVEP